MSDVWNVYDFIVSDVLREHPITIEQQHRIRLALDQLKPGNLLTERTAVIDVCSPPDFAEAASENGGSYRKMKPEFLTALAYRMYQINNQRYYWSEQSSSAWIEIAAMFAMKEHFNRETPTDGKE